MSGGRAANRECSHQAVRLAILAAAMVLAAGSAHAWDSRTHELIARLAVDALPPSPLRQLFEAKEPLIERDAIAPDLELRQRYGHAEEIRHYVNLEYFGSDPFAQLQPDFASMKARYGARLLDRTGTLPWTIEELADASGKAWRERDCAGAVQLSGYLAHYAGDASQPLHSTRYYDGYAGDAGVHRRFEAAVDHEVRAIAPLARKQVHVQAIDSVWSAAIGEIRDAHLLVSRVIMSDRALRAEAGGDRGVYDRLLMDRDGSMIVGQVAAASSVLGSIWLFEWKDAGSPARCPNPPVAVPAPAPQPF